MNVTRTSVYLKHDADVCAICFDTQTDDICAYVITPCQHPMHMICYSQWKLHAGSVRACPVCKQKIPRSHYLVKNVYREKANIEVIDLTLD